MVKHICENCCDVDIRKDMWSNVVLTGEGLLAGGSREGV
jgi:hypothetical protein